MNIKQEREIISEDEIKLYDYWEILVKRKTTFFGIFFVPVIVAIIIALNIPRYYRGECLIKIPTLPDSNASSVITAPNIVDLVGNIDDVKKSKIFKNNSNAIKKISISFPKKSTDKISIIIESKSRDIIPQATKDIFDYINNIPEIRDEFGKKNAEIDFKMQKLTEAKKVNLVFLNFVTDMMKKKQINLININPADLIKKDADLSIDINNLGETKSNLLKKGLNWKENTSILDKLLIIKQPSNTYKKNIIIITGILSFMAGIFAVLFLDHIERLKMRNNE